ncbi:MAG: Transport energizing protein ExbD/TolR family [Fibrobacteres bacterium]|nr:Transport energizing protein ExbD/TolR family [Fibrobacterota bacterium]
MAAASSAHDEDGITSINITPLVDVFLVLLILVMITSSLLDHREIPVSVPKAANGGEKAPKASGLTMDVDRKVYLDGVESDSAAIALALRDEVSKDSTHQVLIAADQRLLYEDVVRLLDWVKGSGVRKYALKVSKPG